MGFSDVATAGPLGIMSGGYGTYRAGKAARAQAEYNANVIGQETLAQQRAISAQARQLATDQRGIKAKQRMSVSGRGGLNEGTDLLTLADEAEKMQLDQLEMVRQRDIVGIKGREAIIQERERGKAAFRAARWTAYRQMGDKAIQVASMGMSGAGSSGDTKKPATTSSSAGYVNPAQAKLGRQTPTYLRRT
jgi:hypothetical protein